MILPSRKLTAAFVCVFILGAVAGAMIYMNFADLRFNDFLNRTNNPTALADRINRNLAHDYQLDADEQARIAPLSQEMAQNLYRLRHQFAVDMLATLENSHQKIGQQMTPSQRDAYQKANEERRKRAISVLMPDAGSAPAVH